MTIPTYDSKQQRQAELMLLFLTTIWGSTFIIIRNTLHDIGPFTLLALRFSIGFLVVFILFFGRMRRVKRMDVVAGAILGVMFFAGNVLQTTGLQYTTAGVSGFITALSVVIVPVLAIVALRQRPTRGALVGIVLATVGLALLSLNDNLTLGYGDLLTLGCAVAFAFHIVYVTKFAHASEPTVMVAVQLGLSAIVATVLAFTTETVGTFTPDVLLAGLYLGLLPTAFCFVLQVYGQRRTTATRAALLFTAEPVFAATFAFLVAGELLTGRGLVGCALILAGMIAAELA